MKSAKYWKSRSVKRTAYSEKQAEQRSKEIARLYAKAEQQVIQDINEVYRTYAKGAGIDVDRLLKKLSVDDTTKFWLDMRKKGHLEYMGQNYKSRITRLEQIKGQIYDTVRSIAPKENEAHTKAHTQTINDAFNRTIFDTSKGVGENISFGGLNPNTLDSMLRTKWSGRNYSENVWSNTDRIATYVKDELGTALLTGKSPRRVTEDVQEKFKVSKTVADRLIRTETNYFQNDAEAKANEEMGLERYIYVATLDRRTSTICGDTDGSVFLLKKREVGVNYPPLHPNCRSTTRVYLGKEFEPKTRIARDEDGNNVQVENMTYRKWRELNKVDDVKPTNPPKPTAPKTKISVVDQSNKQKVTTKTVKHVNIPIEPTQRGGVDPRLKSLFRSGMVDVYKRFPQAFDRLDKVLISRTQGQPYNLNGVYKFGVRTKNSRLVRGSDGQVMRAPDESRLVRGKIYAEQNIAIRVPKGSNDLETYSSRVAEIHKRGSWASDNPKAVIYHELGHSLEVTMLLQKEKLYGTWDKIAGMNGREVSINDMRPDITQLNQKMRGHSVSRDLVERTLREAYPNETLYQATRKHISTYATKEPAEAFAELFEKTMTGDGDKVTKIFERNLKNELEELELL